VRLPRARRLGTQVRSSNKDGYSKGKENVASRAYLHFKTVSHLAEFHRGYDGHVFRDGKGIVSAPLYAQFRPLTTGPLGNTTQVLVEFAPYSRVPQGRTKQDPRMSTIDDGAGFPNNHLAFATSSPLNKSGLRRPRLSRFCRVAEQDSRAYRGQRPESNAAGDL
jgi:hypothetical protein